MCVAYYVDKEVKNKINAYSAKFHEVTRSLEIDQLDELVADKLYDSAFFRACAKLRGLPARRCGR